MNDLSHELWRSSHEVIPSDDQHEYLVLLNQIDAKIAADLEKIKPISNSKSIYYRILRRLYFEAKNIFRPIFKKPLISIQNRWFRYVTSLRVLPEGKVVQSENFSIEVWSLQTPHLSQLLEKSTADYWALTREPNQLLKNGIGHIETALSISNALCWFGDSRNRRGEKFQRPVFSKLLFRQVEAFGPLLVVRKDLLLSIPPSIPQPLWPLYLSLQLSEYEIELIPAVLAVGDEVHALSEKEASQANLMVQEAVSKNQISAVVSPGLFGRRDVTYIPNSHPLVSIIIPTRGSGASASTSYVFDAVSSILDRSTYPNYEIILVADDPTPQSVVTKIDEIAKGKAQWVRWSKEFNFSQKMNLGVSVASGQIMLFLNDDVEIVSPGWIESMQSLLGINKVGYVGALLFFEDQTIQHAGHFYKGGAGHISFGEQLKLKDPKQLITLDRIASGVTAACSMVTKDLFTSVGGFSPDFPGNFNDVDLGMKIRRAGYQIAVSGKSRLYHFESKTRDASVKKSEILTLQKRWKSEMNFDSHFREITD